MIMLESKKYIALPPGATIVEQLNDVGMTTKEFADCMGLTVRGIDMLLAGKMALSQDIACKLESVLGVPAKFWNNLETIYRTKLEEISKEHNQDNKKRSTYLNGRCSFSFRCKWLCFNPNKTQKFPKNTRI